MRMYVHIYMCVCVCVCVCECVYEYISTKNEKEYKGYVIHLHWSGFITTFPDISIYIYIYILV